MSNPGENCSSACVTRDHTSFGECVRAKCIAAMWTGGTRPSFGQVKRFSRENQAFRDAVADGLKPQAVSFGAVNKAYDAASRG